MPEAVLFDLDGVLVASAPVVEASWSRWAGERGVDFGIAAGLRVVALTTSHQADALAQADAVYDSMEALRRAELDTRAPGRRSP